MKPKIGRPKLAKAEAKGKILGVRFTPAERKQLEDTAHRAKKTLSNWVRETLLDQAGSKRRAEKTAPDVSVVQ